MELQFLFETLLFYKSKPCYYKIFHAGDIFIGEPVEHHFYSKSIFPYFIIRKKNEVWTAEGIENEEKLTSLFNQLEKHITST